MSTTDLTVHHDPERETYTVTAPDGTETTVTLVLDSYQGPEVRAIVQEGSDHRGVYAHTPEGWTHLGHKALTRMMGMSIPTNPVHEAALAAVEASCEKGLADAAMAGSRVHGTREYERYLFDPIASTIYGPLDRLMCMVQVRMEQERASAGDERGVFVSYEEVKEKTLGLLAAAMDHLSVAESPQAFEAPLRQGAKVGVKADSQEEADRIAYDLLP